ncbi:unnamed protein product [Acanthoscelides obtectus]|uniref:Uncharacterized protein n=1 Tax=Acanthoscelides obtectus TaxID=200917 RepID=A0A9P0KY65_ACAOB|nr:unnamed protein product [Acanthoscelides obtectus]CAK1676665.1 hypothetical protein AOBTE_LOCUS30892 [Acanthoscelides obtectus]
MLDPLLFSKHLFPLGNILTQIHSIAKADILKKMRLYKRSI